jgi:fibronectin type 3 domain-containing protein
MRGISHGGRPGQPTRIDVPIVSPPPPVTDVRATFTEHAITLNWQPPVAEAGGPVIAFNVYPAEPDAAPLNSAPQQAPSFDHTAMMFGKEQCYVVRTVEVVQNVTLESESSSPPACTTPKDIFPPAPPKELRGIATEGAIDLTWEASAESDLAGYLVLRAEGADDTLRPLMKEPIHETTFHDPTVKAGVSYVYAVIALDATGNRSKESARFTETAR